MLDTLQTKNENTLRTANGAVNATTELRERLCQAGLDADYMSVVDAFLDEQRREQRRAMSPVLGYIAGALDSQDFNSAYDKQQHGIGYMQNRGAA
jgi:hypothetical protein